MENYLGSEYHRNNARKSVQFFGSIMEICQYCGKEINLPNIKRHEKYCKKNPANIRCCLFCEELTTKPKFCSMSCAAKYNNHLRVKPEIYMKQRKEYVEQAKFKFNLGDYPNEFDLKLLIKLGMYKPKLNNTGALSRDHMYSITDGFNNKVDPRWLSHPANCELMPHKENNKKNSNSSITINQLMERIEQWHKKYGV